MSDPLSETAVERIAVRVQERGAASRYIENGLAIVGILQAGLYGTLEALASVGWRLGKCEAETGFPWITAFILGVCVLPKTVGRATAGKVWETLGAIVGRKAP